MPNALLTPTAVTRESLRVLHQKLNFVGNINRQYDDSFAKSGAKIGDSLKIRLPNEYTVRTGATLQAQDTNETSVTLQVATQKGVDLNFTSVDLTLSLDDFSKRIIQPAMARLAAAIEADAMSMYKDVGNSIWDGGSALTYNNVLDGGVLLTNTLTPQDQRVANLNPRDMADVVKDTKTLFNHQSAIGEQYKEGEVGRAAGFTFAENTMWPRHTRGSANTGYTTNTTTGTLATDGTAYSSITVASGTGTINKGDVFTIANLFAVHPETKQITTQLLQLVAAADYAGGAGVVTLATPIILGGARQNAATTSTSATAAISFAGTASTGVGTSLLFHKDAFAFATADLVMPDGVDWKARETFDGISMRMVRQYDINNDKFPTRLDVLYGYKTLRAQLAARLHNN